MLNCIAVSRAKTKKRPNRYLVRERQADDTRRRIVEAPSICWRAKVMPG